MGTGQSVPSEAALIVNTHSRRGRKLFREAKAKLVAAGITLTRAVAVRNAAKLDAEVAAAIAAGAKMVIVGGGDGSVSGAVDSFIGCDCVFALLPLGPANSFARTLGIPVDLDGPIDELGRAHV